MKRPMVNQELCIGCGSCETICPAVFKVINEKSNVIAPDQCSECDCQSAADLCPVGAISFGGE